MNLKAINLITWVHEARNLVQHEPWKCNKSKRTLKQKWSNYGSRCERRKSCN